MGALRRRGRPCPVAPGREIHGSLCSPPASSRSRPRDATGRRDKPRWNMPLPRPVRRAFAGHRWVDRFSGRPEPEHPAQIVPSPEGWRRRPPTPPITRRAQNHSSLPGDMFLSTGPGRQMTHEHGPTLPGPGPQQTAVRFRAGTWTSPTPVQPLPRSSGQPARMEHPGRTRADACTRAGVRAVRATACQGRRPLAAGPTVATRTPIRDSLTLHGFHAPAPASGRCGGCLVSAPVRPAPGAGFALRQRTTSRARRRLAGSGACAGGISPAPSHQIRRTKSGLDVAESAGSG